MSIGDRFRLLAIARSQMQTDFRYLGECEQGVLVEDVLLRPFIPYLITPSGPNCVDVKRVKSMDYWDLYDRCTHAAQERKKCDLRGLSYDHIDPTV